MPARVGGPDQVPGGVVVAGFLPAGGVHVMAEPAVRVGEGGDPAGGVVIDANRSMAYRNVRPTALRSLSAVRYPPAVKDNFSPVLR